MSGSTPIKAGGSITATFLDANIAGAWVALTPSGGWTNHAAGTVPLQVRLMNQVTAWVFGVIAPGTVTSGTTIFTLPAGFLPLSIQPLVLADYTSSPDITAIVQTSGAVQLNIGATAGHVYYVNGLIAMDT